MKPLEIEGITYNRVKKIGRGLFSIAYLLDNDQVLILTRTDQRKQNDITKQAIVDYWNWFENSRNLDHLPKITHIGEVYYCNNFWECYLMPRYNKLTAKSKAWSDYKMIKMAQNKLSVREIVKDKQKAIYTVINSLPEHLQIAFNHYIEALQNWDEIGSFYLDIKKSNFAVNQQDQLILLDPFVSVNALCDWLG